jgi:hypothetical protein
MLLFANHGANSMSKILTIAAALTISMPAAAAELVGTNRCTDKQCQSDFGRPMAYCQMSATRTALGENTMSQENFYANYQRGAQGWLFDVRTNTDRVLLKLALRDFDERSGNVNFTFRDSVLSGTCRRFSGQALAGLRTQRVPVPDTSAPSAVPYGVPNEAFVRTWDSYEPSTGHFIQRTLYATGGVQFRLIKKGRDATGVFTGESSCLFDTTGWSDCVGPAGNHYQLRAASIGWLVRVANGEDPDPQSMPPAFRYGPWQTMR